MIIIGITGTLGSGKGTVVEYLVSKYGFQHYSVRNFLTEEIERRGMSVNRDTMTEVANDLREKHGPGFIAEELYKLALSSGKNSVIESIRTVGEIETLKTKGVFYLFAVDAPQKTRYERITSRASVTDAISFEKFQEDENREMLSDDPNKQNLSGCIKKADFVFNNNGTIEELQKQIDVVMNKIKK